MALLILVFLSLPVSGCGDEIVEGEYHIEYLNKEKSRIVKVP